MTRPSSRREPWLILFALVLIHVRDAESQSSTDFGSYGYGFYGSDDYGYGYGGGVNRTSWPNETTTCCDGTANSTGSPPAICTMTPTWFPVGYENAASPAPLQYDSQLATGWAGLGDPLRVALSYTAPTFYLGANWFLSTEGEVPMECTGALLDNLTTSCANTTTTTTTTTTTSSSSSTGRRLLAFARRLLQLTTDDDGESATVLTPVAYAVSWSLNHGPPMSLGIFKPGDNRGAPTINMEGIYADLPDGDYCVQANITALQDSAVVTVKGAARSLPCSNITRTTQFCFAKVVQQPYAKVKYSSCSGNVTVDFSSITPSPLSVFTSTSGTSGNGSDYGDYYGDGGRPANSTYDDYDYPYGSNEAPLYSVVLNVYGNGTRSPSASDQLPLDEVVDIQVVITDPQQTTASLSTYLQDGQYVLHVRMMLMSRYPSLLDLPRTKYNDDGSATYLDVLVNGSKGDSITVHGKQSGLFGLECPPDEVEALPAERVFQWQQLGGGALNCFIDGALKNNAEDGCASPYTLDLKDTKNHTLTVVLTDVCGESIIRTFDFSAYGCTNDSDMTETPTPVGTPSADSPTCATYISFLPAATTTVCLYGVVSTTDDSGTTIILGRYSKTVGGVMQYTGGAPCEANTQYSSSVTLSCGADTTLGSVSREGCNYIISMTSPSACPDAPLAPPPPPTYSSPYVSEPPSTVPGASPANSRCSNIVPLWGPCGGTNGPSNDFSGPDAEWQGFCCDAASYCQRQEGNPWYWQCVPLPEAPVAAPVPELPTSSPPGCAHGVPKWGACGGKNGPSNDGTGTDAAWKGFCCAPGTSCQKQEGNVWYWQCL